jgi:hypothetical protein
MLCLGLLRKTPDDRFYGFCSLSLDLKLPLLG